MTYQVVDRCDFQPGNVIDGRYSVKKSLGEGSFGAVYLVQTCQQGEEPCHAVKHDEKHVL